MRYLFDPKKQVVNLKRHGYDFKDAPQAIVTFEDQTFAYEEQRLITLGLLRRQMVVIPTAETEEEIRGISMRKAERHEKQFTTPTFDDDSPISQADIDSGKLNLRKASAGRVIQPKKQVTLYLDANLVEHFKHMAGEQGYQTLINDALKSSVQRADIAETLRQGIREETKGRRAA